MKFQFFVMAALLLASQQINASSCFAATPEKARDWADVVFAGEVTKVQYVDADSNSIYNEPRIIVTFKVSDVWKGDVHPTMTIHTVYNKVSLSGLIVKQGDRFIIYAKRLKAKDWLAYDKREPIKGIALPKPDDEILTDGGACARSGPLANASEDLKKLGASKMSK